MVKGRTFSKQRKRTVPAQSQPLKFFLDKYECPGRCVKRNLLDIEINYLNKDIGKGNDSVLKL